MCHLSEQMKRIVGAVGIAKICMRKKTHGRFFSLHKDVTGHLVEVKTRVALDLIDESIIDILSSNNDARLRLSEVITTNDNCNYARILRTFEGLRYSMSHSTPALVADLQYLEAQLASSKLTQKCSI